MEGTNIKKFKIEGPALFLAAVLFLIVAFGLKSAMSNSPSRSDIGLDILYGTTLSIIASIVFYYVMVVLLERRRKRHMLSFFKSTMTSISSEGRELFRQMANQVSSQVTFETMTLADITAICGGITYLQAAPLIVNTSQPYLHANWMYYLLVHRNRSIELIERTFRFMPFMEAEHVKLLNDILNGLHFRMVGTYWDIFKMQFPQAPHIASPANSSSLQNIDSRLFEYFSQCKHLEEQLRDYK
ncbi:MAG: hypothetical protein EOP04_18200 [Proteobacteria bacterium]|nr:MAG: hypothetical protein EOP04_18200 [Pseudomonadota bacterium]